MATDFDDQHEQAHLRIEKSMEQGFKEIRSGVTEVKADVKCLSTAVVQLVVLEEKQASLLRVSEQNAEAINELWREMSSLREVNTDLQVKVAEAHGTNHERGKVVWQVVAGVGAVGGLAVAAFFTQQ